MFFGEISDCGAGKTVILKHQGKCLMSRLRSVSALVLVAFAAGFFVSSASASITFHRLTDNGNEDVSGQLSVDVTALGEDQVKFAFDNVGPVHSIIAAIYFGDGALLKSGSIINPPGVAFATGATTPPDLPGASKDYKTHQFFAADADDPAPKFGVDSFIATDSVSIVFDLVGTKTLDDVLTAITNPTDASHVYIGLHIQSIGCKDGCDSYVNDDNHSAPSGPIVPEASTFVTWLLLGASIAGAGFWNKRRKSV